LGTVTQAFDKPQGTKPARITAQTNAQKVAAVPKKMMRVKYPTAQLIQRNSHQLPNSSADQEKISQLDSWKPGKILRHKVRREG